MVSLNDTLGYDDLNLTIVIAKHGQICNKKKDIDQTEVCPLLIVIAQNLPKHSKCLLV